MQAEASTSTLPGPSKQTKPDTRCRYYLRSGKCRRGSKCLFSHDSTHRPVQPGTTEDSAKDPQPSSSRLSAKAPEFDPPPPTRPTLSATANAFHPTTQPRADDEDAWQDLPTQSQPAKSAPPASSAVARLTLKGVPASVPTHILPCNICMELPTVYAQLPNCDHHFCPPCLNRWRRQHGQAKAKNCPTCRTASRFTFVTPEPFTGAARVLALQRFKERAAKTPCKNFEKSKGKKPFCAFGDECMYLHEVDGKEFKFGSGRVRVNRSVKGRKRVMRTGTGRGRSIGAEFFERINDMDERVRMFLSARVLSMGPSTGVTVL